MIASYPRFSKLSFSHKDFIYDFTAQFEPYADFNFICLYAWDFDNDAEVSILNNNLVIRVPDYITLEPIFSVLGKTKITETLQILYERGDSEIKMLPQSVVDKAKENELFGWKEDENHHDYIFDLKAQAELKGNLYKNKRKKSHKFINGYGDRVETKEVKLNNKETVDGIISVVDIWVHKITKDVERAKIEKLAISRLLEKAASLNIVCYEIFLDSKPAGFSINEILGNGYALCHFHKTDTKYTNIDVFFTSYVASQLLKKGCSYVNWEQDMGLAGLRHLKRSWKPTKALKKYTIIPKN